MLSKQYYLYMMKVVSVGACQCLQPLQLHLTSKQGWFALIFKDFQPFLECLKWVQWHGFHGKWMNITCFSLSMLIWTSNMYGVWVMKGMCYWVSQMYGLLTGFPCLPSWEPKNPMGSERVWLFWGMV